MLMMMGADGQKIPFHVQRSRPALLLVAPPMGCRFGLGRFDGGGEGRHAIHGGYERPGPAGEARQKAKLTMVNGLSSDDCYEIETKTSQRECGFSKKSKNGA